MPEPVASSPPVWADVQPVIDDELASLPDEQNLLEAITLPLGMPFLGRG